MTSDSQRGSGFSPRELARQHYLLGWLGLLISMLMGISLEAMHGLKIGYYLDVGNDTRRLMWTLAHAHGSLFSLLHVGLASYVATFASEQDKTLARVSILVTAGWVAMPLGFFLGGLWHYDGDPGLGVFLVPFGAIVLVAAMCMLLLHTRRLSEKPQRPPGPDVTKSGQRKKRR